MSEGCSSRPSGRPERASAAEGHPIIKYLFSYEKVEQDVRELVVILRADLVPS